MEIYKEKYIKYKSKYIKLKKKIDENLSGGKDMSVMTNNYNQIKNMIPIDTKEKIGETNFVNNKIIIDTKEKSDQSRIVNDKIIIDIDYNQKIKYRNKLLNEKTFLYLIDEDKSIIDIELAKKIINGSINISLNKDNFLNLNITSEIYHSINIQNNTLSLPGLSIYLIDKMDNEWDVSKIHDLLKNKIIGKHTLYMPYQTEIKGVLLEDLIKILDLNNNKININKFYVNVKFEGQEELNKIMNENKNSTFGTINTVIKDFDYTDFKNNYYEDYVDINDYFM